MATRPWTPADMTSATPVLSLNPTNASTLTNNSGAIALASEYGSITASNTASNSPAVLAVNGYNFLDYTGGKTLPLSTTTGLPQSNTPRTILIIAMGKTSGGTQPGIFGYGSGNGGSFYVSKQDGNDPNNGSPLMGTGGGGSNVNASAANTLVNNYRIIIGTITSAAAMSLRVDGAVTTSTSSTGLNTNTSSGTVGRNPSYGDAFGGIIGVVFMASGIASQDEIWRLESYYAFQCGQQSHIGSDNPYASAPPTVTTSSGSTGTALGYSSVIGSASSLAAVSGQSVSYSTASGSTSSLVSVNGVATGSSIAVASSAAASAPSIGISTGSSTARGSGFSLSTSNGVAIGGAVSIGSSQATASSFGSANGSATAIGVASSAVVGVATGYAIGSSQAFGSGSSLATSTGYSAGSSAASGALGNVSRSNGSSTGASSAIGTATAAIQVAGQACGSSTAAGTAGSIGRANGYAQGQSIARSTPAMLAVSTGAALGSSTALGSGIVLSMAAGQAFGFSTAFGAGRNKSPLPTPPSRTVTTPYRSRIAA